MATKYDNKVKALIAKAESMGDDQVAKAIAQLNAARKKVAATVGKTDWQLYQLPKLKAAIDGAMADFATQYGKDLKTGQKDFWAFGQEMVDQSLNVVGISAVLPAIDTAMLVAMQNYSRSLVNSLGADAASKIYNEMAMGLMGQKTPFEVMQAVGNNLTDKGIFSSIAARAETITRQECGRILEAASQARMEAAAEVVPGLKKQWQHGVSRVPRMSHIAAVGQIRDVNEPFMVGGEALMYPRDPAGSPGNTINCSCYTVPYMDGWSETEGKQKKAA
ncbi:MAG: hypothetical protein LLG40_15685 [Deltaproteobacteria bacterium]|nr:hypothetical protein [Deltaproteobacteria bacterium]